MRLRLLFGLILAAGVVCAVPAFGAPVTGDAIIMGTIGEASNLIPPLSSDSASREVSGNIFVGLLKYDKNLKMVPWAAESYEVLEGGLHLRFRMRPGIRWQDGVEMTAEDVAFTYRMMTDKNTPTMYRGDYLAISSFTVTGKYAFEVRYDKPYARALETWLSAIMPRHLLEKEDLRATKYARSPVGNGPYRFKEWIPGSRIVLEANPDYFEGRPNIDRIVYSVIPDTTTMFLELKAGAVDMMGLSPLQYVYQSKDPAIADGYNLFRYLSFSYDYLAYNLDSPLFKDVRVRRAIAHAVDKQEIIAGALLGQGVPSIGPYVPGMWAYNAQITDYSTDIKKAEVLLAEAGWKKDADGLLRNAKGLPFTFTILTNQGNDRRIKAAVIIQDRLKRLGMDVRIRTVEWAVFTSQFIDKGFFDTVLLGWTVPIEPDLYDVWHSSRMRPNGLNFIRYSNKELDVILEKARSIFDRAERKKLYDRAQVILHEDQPYCFLYVPYSLPAVQKRFQGIEEAPAGISYNFNDWWVPQNRQRYTITP